MSRLALLALLATSLAYAAEPAYTAVVVVEMDDEPQFIVFVKADGSDDVLSAEDCADKEKVCLDNVTRLVHEKKADVIRLYSQDNRPRGV